MPLYIIYYKTHVINTNFLSRTMYISHYVPKPDRHQRHLDIIYLADIGTAPARTAECIYTVGYHKVNSLVINI